MQRAAAMTFLVAIQLAGAPPPPKVIREIRLSQIIPGRPEFASAALSFSPDENWIAMVGTYQFDGRRQPLHVGPSGSASVFLVPRNGPVDQRIEIDPGLYPTEGAGWSPHSDSFFVQGLASNPRGTNAGWIAKLWNLRGEELSHHDGRAIFGFLDAEHLLARGIPAKTTNGAFETIDLNGQVVDTWAAPEHWMVVDISSDRHLLAVLPDDQATQTLVVDYPSKKVVLTQDNPYQDLSKSRGNQTREFFAEGGRTLCSVGSALISESKFDLATECWDVDSGKRIAKFDGFRGGTPAAASSRGSRIVLTHYTMVRATERPPVNVGVDYVVWDYRSGTQVAAWKAPTRTTIAQHAPFVAISSTGRYLAEIVGDVLRIYELP